MRTLTLSGQVLLYGQVDHVIVRLYAKDLFGELDGTAGFLTFYI
jgi:hypothetical protein